MTDEELRYFENILEKGGDFCKTLIDNSIGAVHLAISYSKNVARATLELDDWMNPQ